MLQPNILINHGVPPRACISDFGLHAVAPRTLFDPTTCGTDVGDTFDYMAPELFSKGAVPSQEADIYAFGMVVYEVVTGARPFGQRWAMELPLLITSGIRPDKPEDPVAIGFGQRTWEFVEKCWDRNSKRRPTAGEALGHFERVARASTAVDPGPTIPACGADDETLSELDTDPERYCESCGPESISDRLTAPKAELFAAD